MDTASLKKFMTDVSKGDFSSSLFSKESRDALLKLSQFDRASADNIALK
jgi:hypothetical protein